MVLAEYLLTSLGFLPPEREPQRRRHERRELGEEDPEPEQDDEVWPVGEALVDEGLPHHRDKAARERHEGVPSEGPIGANVRLHECMKPNPGVDRGQDSRADGAGIRQYLALLLLGGD